MVVKYGRPQGVSTYPYVDGFSGNYYLDVAKGLVPDTRVEHRFGLSEDVDPGNGMIDIWDGCANDLDIAKQTTYNFSTKADIFLLASTGNSDFQMMYIRGLDGDGRMAEQEVQLGGNTPVAIATPLIRVIEMHNQNGTPHAGDVYLCTGSQTFTSGIPDDPALVRAVCHNENQQTQMAIYSVPYDSSLYITHGWASIGKQNITEVVITIWIRRLGGVFKKLHTLALQTSGSSSDHRLYEVPIKLDPGDDILYRAESFSNNTSVTCGFHGILERHPDDIVTPPPSISGVTYQLTDASGDALTDGTDNLITIGV